METIIVASGDKIMYVAKLMLYEINYTVLRVLKCIETGGY